jgi:hypothetical protein
MEVEMAFIRRVLGALMAGAVFVVFQALIFIVFGYVIAKLNGVAYVFRVILIEGIRSGLSLGSAVTVLAFAGMPRRYIPAQRMP